MRALRGSGRSAAAVEASIAEVLVEVEPLLRIDHCRIRLVEFSRASGLLTVSMGGSCSDCDISPTTFSIAIESRVKMQVPEVREVRVIE
jgi:Fe-S cluster biogenesis protein NfuA